MRRRARFRRHFRYDIDERSESGQPRAVLEHGSRKIVALLVARGDEDSENERCTVCVLESTSSLFRIRTVNICVCSVKEFSSRGQTKKSAQHPRGRGRKSSLRLPRRKERTLLPVKGAFVVLSNYVFTLDVVEPGNGSATPCKLIQPGYASRISREELS